MTRIGVPVPPGFTITTEACNAYLAGGGKFPDGIAAAPVCVCPPKSPPPASSERIV